MRGVSIKTSEQVRKMAEGGRRLAEIKAKLLGEVKAGRTPVELENLAQKLISEAGGKPSFMMVPGYSWSTCINVNEVVVHGIPDARRFKEGDVVGIDVGMFYQGWHTDTSVTVSVGKASLAIEKFLKIGKTALEKAIGVAHKGNCIADISQVIQKTVEGAGYSSVKALTGHGIGRNLHEEPAIPCFVVGDKNKSVKIEPGMVLAIEVMYNEGVDEVMYKNRDGWTIITTDGKISGLFEETVAVTESGPKILT